MDKLKEVDGAQSSVQPAKETKKDSSSALNSKRKRGTLLTLWLVLLIIANAYGTIRNILDIVSNASVVLNVPLWAIYTLAVGSVLIMVSVIAMLMWKKWGFYLFCALVVLGFAVNLIAGAGVFAIIGLIGIAITYLLLRNSWSLFE